MVPLKHRAPELQRSKAPEKLYYFYSYFVSKKKEGQNQSTVSISRLKPLLILHLIPINSLSCCGLMENTHLDRAFPLRCFQRLCNSCVATQRFPLEGELIDHRHDHYRSSRTMSDWSQCSNANTGYGPNCLTTFWTQLMCHFNGRTAQPLGPTTAPGCDKPTSRCQTFSSMWTLGED